MMSIPKSLMAVFSFLFLAAALFGQEGESVELIIKKTQGKLETIKNLSANLTYSLSSPSMKNPVVKQGQMVLSQNKYRINFPQKEEIVCNGIFVWMVSHDNKEITKTTVGPEAFSPQSLYRMYENNFKLKYDGKEAGFHKITIFSNQDKTDSWKTELWIRADYIIVKAKIYGRNGAVIEYAMDAIQINTAIDKAIFEAPQYNGYILNE